MALLAHLAAVPGAFHRRDILLGLFWPELDQPRARTALNQAIRFLRRQLGGLSRGTVISRGAEELGIDTSALWCDAAAFREHFDAERYSEALALYRGDFLPGYFSDRSAAFDEWLERERARLRQRAAKAARGLAEAREREENFTTAVATARRAVELSGDDERVVRELLLMLERLGDRTGALHAYEAFARHVADEFGAAPAPETVALINRVRSRTEGAAPMELSESRDTGRVAPVVVPARQRDLPSPVSSPADRLHHWRVERELGRGGMSIVFLARDEKHDRHVALKMLRPELGTDGIERFLREVQITARLAHPNILPLIDSGACDGQLYLVTPYVAGESLRLRLRREGRLPLHDAVRLAREIAEALDYAHREGVVHRDIKPENILLSDGHAVVADFGIARALAASGAPPTLPERNPDAIVGSRAYMSPEQASCAGTAGPRADLYSLGCVMFEMLTGDQATERSTAAGLRRRRPDVPLSVARLVADCMAVRLEDRPESAAAVLRVLGVVGTVRPLASRYRLASVRRRVIAIPGGAIIIAAVAFGAWLGVVPRPALVIEDMQPFVASQELEMDPAISPDGQRVAYASGWLGRMRIFVRRVDGGAALALSGGLDGDHRWPQWSPDGLQVLFIAKPDAGPLGGALYVASSFGSAPKLLFRPGGAAETPAWSPDGSLIAYSDQDHIVVYPRDGSPPRRIATGSQLHSPVFSPDGRRLAFVSGNNWRQTNFNTAFSAICTVTLAGTGSRCLTDNVHSNTNPVWSADGKRVLFISDAESPGDVYEQRISQDGRPVRAPVRLTTGLGVFSLSLSADRSRAVYSVVRLRSQIWSAPLSAAGATPASALRIVAGEAQAIEGLDVSTDGQWLAFDSDRGGNMDIYKMPIDGGEPIRLTSDSALDFQPRWSRDGREIAYFSLRNGNRDIRAMTAEGRDDRNVTTGPVQEGYPAWSPDGHQLVFMSHWGSPQGLYVTSRDERGQWTAPRELARNCGRPRWSPDGTWISCVASDPESTVYLLPASGGSPRRLVGPPELGASARFAVWGRDSGAVYVHAVDGDGGSSFWAVPVAGGAPRLLLRLDDPLRRPRREEFATDGRRLFFTVAADESDIRMMNLKR